MLLKIKNIGANRSAGPAAPSGHCVGQFLSALFKPVAPTIHNGAIGNSLPVLWAVFPPDKNPFPAEIQQPQGLLKSRHETCCSFSFNPTLCAACFAGACQ
jgi:hypothetical protein